MEARLDVVPHEPSLLKAQTVTRTDVAESYLGIASQQRNRQLARERIDHQLVTDLTTSRLGRRTHGCLVNGRIVRSEHVLDINIRYIALVHLAARVLHFLLREEHEHHIEILRPHPARIHRSRQQGYVTWPDDLMRPALIQLPPHVRVPGAVGDHDEITDGGNLDIRSGVFVAAHG